MRKILMAFLLLTFVFACKSSTTKQEEAYHRDGSRQQREAAFRNKVFAAYDAEGKLYATYALATLVEKRPNSDGKYTVRFTDGPYKGKTIKTADVILKTAPADLENLRRGVVVLRDFLNPPNAKDLTYGRWNKAVVSDVSRIADGKIVIEFPRDSNDFMATKETVYQHNLRVVVLPALKDPRTFIP